MLSDLFSRGLILNYVKGLKELSGPKIKNCLDAKGVILYSKIAKISKNAWFYIIKLAILCPDNLKLRDLIFFQVFFRYKIDR